MAECSDKYEPTGQTTHANSSLESLYVPGRQVIVWLDLWMGWLQRGATAPSHSDVSLQLGQEVCPGVEERPGGQGRGCDIPLSGQ